jgi:hypothetical protein
MPQPIIPPSVNKLITDQRGQISTYPFPKNFAAELPVPTRKAIFLWMLKNYIWPQIQERKPYEESWDKMLKMAKAVWTVDDLKLAPDTKLSRQKKIDELEGTSDPVGRTKIADTIIFDAVDRLTNLNHFIAFKD